MTLQLRFKLGYRNGYRTERCGTSVRRERAFEWMMSWQREPWSGGLMGRRVQSGTSVRSRQTAFRFGSTTVKRGCLLEAVPPWNEFSSHPRFVGDPQTSPDS